MKNIVFKIAVVIAAISALASCRMFEYNQIKGYDTIGIVEKSNDEEDMIAETVLTSMLPEMKGENGFAKAEILGTSGGKTYAIVSYGSFDYADKSVEKADGGNMIVEMESSDQIDYKSMSGEEFTKNPDGFVPEDLQRRLPDNQASLSMADYYAMTADELDRELTEEVRDYFMGD